jgi:hypothetical protein
VACTDALALWFARLIASKGIPRDKRVKGSPPTFYGTPKLARKVDLPERIRHAYQGRSNVVGSTRSPVRAWVVLFG